VLIKRSNPLRGLRKTGALRRRMYRTALIDLTQGDFSARLGKGSRQTVDARESTALPNGAGSSTYPEGESHEADESRVTEAVEPTRTTSTVVGLVVMVALLAGVASTALAANGGNFVLGALTNSATTITKLTGDIARPSAPPARKAVSVKERAKKGKAYEHHRRKDDAEGSSHAVRWSGEEPGRPRHIATPGAGAGR
jgi:hypothetical protein